MEVWNGILSYIGSVDVAAAICLILGTGLVIVEMFTPGFAVPGISGITLLLFGIVLSAGTFLEGLVVFLVIMTILTVVLIIVLRSATRGALHKSPLILKNAETSEEGYISTHDMKYFIGKEGHSLTMLRPAGTCDFDGVRLDVVTEGDFIEKDAFVKIIKVEGCRIVVALR